MNRICSCYEPAQLPQAKLHCSNARYKLHDNVATNVTVELRVGFSLRRELARTNRVKIVSTALSEKHKQHEKTGCCSTIKIENLDAS